MLGPHPASVAALRGGLSFGVGQIALDQRVRELPLRAGELESVPLERFLARSPIAQFLAFGDQLRNAKRQSLHARRATTPSETGRPQMPQ